jgi:aryl-alcohol dehydrogenase-like predicted oxidoreductase
MRPRLKCKIHGIPLVCYCPACRGSVHSQRKAKSSAENGRQGGRKRLPDGEVTKGALYAREYRKRKKAERGER